MENKTKYRVTFQMINCNCQATISLDSEEMIDMQKKIGHSGTLLIESSTNNMIVNYKYIQNILFEPVTETIEGLPEELKKPLKIKKSTKK